MRANRSLFFLSPVTRHLSLSVIEFERELDDSRVVARRDDATERAGVDDLAGHRVDLAARRQDGVEVADGVRQIHMVEQVEELCAELDVLRLGDLEPLDDREVNVRLLWPAQHVAPEVA